MYRQQLIGFTALLLGLLGGAEPVLGQTVSADVVHGTVSGAVLDAENSRPLEGATVVLEADPPGVVAGSGGAFFEGSRGVLSDAAGVYRFEGIAPGTYRLRVTRAGYRPVAVRVEMRGRAESRVSVGLTVDPIPMEAVQVTVDRPQPFGWTSADEAVIAGSRATAARARQREHLPTDARELTHADVIESVTLGETDLFRAFQRLPGVATRDDYTAEMWTRGAPWDQTRVYFDGLPLFNPVHAMGMFSSVNPDAVGGAVLHPGVRPASLAEGAAGVVDLTSRRAGGTGEVNASADVSLASMRFSADQRVLDGRAGWLIAARRSYLDWLAEGVAKLTDDPGMRLPYSFSDLTVRGDLELASGDALQVSGLVERDRIAGDIPDVMHGTEATWGNAAGQVSYDRTRGGLDQRFALGYSRYRSRTTPQPITVEEYSAPSEPESANELGHLVASARVAPSVSGGAFLPWAAGIDIVHEVASADLPAVGHYGGFVPDDAAHVVRESSTLRGGVWAEARWRPIDAFTAEAGIRVDVGEPIANAGAFRAAPRLAARYQLTPGIAFSAGLGRTWQHTQSLGAAGASFSPLFHASQLWLQADGETPAARADIGTLGAEAWIGENWLASANVYLRRTTGVAALDPQPGLLRDRTLFVEATNRASGVELAARRIAGAWTLSGSYTLAKSDMVAEGYTFPSAADRRHTLDLTAMVRAGRSIRFGGAFTGATGAPFTRIYSLSYSCGEPECALPRVGEPNAHRTPAYASLDLLAEWSRAFRSWEGTLYLQLRNALGRDNAVSYKNSGQWCPDSGYTAACATDHAFIDYFEIGMPTLPVIGFRARF